MSLEMMVIYSALEQSAWDAFDPITVCRTTETILSTDFQSCECQINAAMNHGSWTSNDWTA